MLAPLWDRGYVVVEDFVTGDALDRLRLDCDRAAADGPPPSQRGCVCEPTAAYSGETFSSVEYVAVRGAEGYEEEVGEWIVGPGSALTALVRALTGWGTLFLINEQFIVKPGACASPDATTFDWHQDGQYFTHLSSVPPFVSVWIALDDVNEANGTLRVHPGVVAPVDESAGAPLCVPAGSAVVFSSTLWHRSGPNTTRVPRRVFMPQFCAHNLVKWPRVAGTSSAPECFVVECAPKLAPVAETTDSPK